MDSKHSPNTPLSLPIRQTPLSDAPLARGTAVLGAVAFPAAAPAGLLNCAHSSRRLSRFACALLAAVLLFNHRADAANYYWELHGTTGGAGATPHGTWKP